MARVAPPTPMYPPRNGARAPAANESRMKLRRVRVGVAPALDPARTPGGDAARDSLLQIQGGVPLVARLAREAFVLLHEAAETDAGGEAAPPERVRRSLGAEAEKPIGHRFVAEHRLPRIVVPPPPQFPVQRRPSAVRGAEQECGKCEENRARGKEGSTAWRARTGAGAGRCPAGRSRHGSVPDRDARAPRGPLPGCTARTRGDRGCPGGKPHR